MRLNISKTFFIKRLMEGIFIIYIIALFKIILFKEIPLINIFKSYRKMRSINLIPFKSIFEFTTTISGQGDDFNSIANVFGNLIVFIPFGYLVPSIFKRCSKIINVVIVTVGLSLLFEVCQYVLGIGSSDIDDIILNTLGGIIGYAIYYCLKKTFHKVNIENISIIFITILFLVSGSMVAYRKYGIMLHLTSLHEVTHGGNGIPKSKADVTGTFVDCNKDSFYIDVPYNNVEDKKLENNYVYKSKSKTNIAIDKLTEIYSERSSFSDNIVTSIYTKMQRKKSVKFTKDSLVKIWGKVKDGKFTASTIVVYKN